MCDASGQGTQTLQPLTTTLLGFFLSSLGNVDVHYQLAKW